VWAPLSALRDGHGSAVSRWPLARMHEERVRLILSTSGMAFHRVRQRLTAPTSSGLRGATASGMVFIKPAWTALAI
jgi:hypothetical protein